MKICLVNLPMDANYGGTLQRFALCKVLENLGHSVEVLNYKPKKSFIQEVKRVLKWMFTMVQKKRIVPLNVFSIKQFVLFWDETINFTEVYKGGELPTEVVNRNDTFIVGSDQVWRFPFTRDNLELFNLSLVPSSKKKIAYAASMGVEDGGFPEEEKCAFVKALEGFDAISVREYSSAIYLQRFLNDLKVECLLDPTLLLEKEEYKKLFNLGGQAKSNVVSYVLDMNDGIKRLCEQVAFEKGKEFYLLSVEKKFNMDSPKDWISHFWNAEFVVTDSFHGTVFSILFNIPFITVINHDRGAERFLSLLKLLGLEDRVYVPNMKIDLETEINWEEVNKRISKLREKGLCFLRDSLSC